MHEDGQSCGVQLRVPVRNCVRTGLLCHKRNQLAIDVRVGLRAGVSDHVRVQDSRPRLNLRDATWIAVREGVREIAV